ncbi:MAG: Na-K-Cl cotransporter [Deltaproteobacteria bacterium]|nr:Na-K-Cl cotransporter [Deltaproteobacteria bacterium]
MSMQRAKGFGALEGVFRPTLLTILGALLYLREGWLVGSTGLVGALLVIGAAYAITGTTALAVSSIATNVRVRPGGAYAIISQALGLEAGGAIAIPLFTAQALSASMYLYAFAEGWSYLFPSHPRGVVVGVAFVIVGALAWRSASLAFKAQSIIAWLVVIALASGFGGLWTTELQAPTLWAHGEVSLATAFGLFFPAATGIMVGVGMSGELADPRRAIPAGTLGAWALSGLVYAAAAVYYAAIAAPGDLVSNSLVMVDHALWGPLVLLGLLASTALAALSSLVAAPRLLQAMAEHGVLPKSAWLAEQTDDQPRHALIIALGISALGLLSGSLDAIAPLITAAFLVTYLAINLVIFSEQRLGMLSFRPTLRAPSWAPVVGIAACGLGLTSATGTAGMVALIAVMSLYLWLSSRKLNTPWDTVRSGMAVSVAQWIARLTVGMPRSPRAWRPDLLVPVGSLAEAKALKPLVRGLTVRAGSCRLVGVSSASEPLFTQLAAVAGELNAMGTVTTSTSVRADDFGEGVELVLDAQRGEPLPANLLIADGTLREEEDLQQMLSHCMQRDVGLLLIAPHPKHAIRPGARFVVWLSDRAPEWRLELQMGNLDLPLLISWLLTHGEDGGQLTLATAVRDPSQQEAAKAFLAEVIDRGRLSGRTATFVSAAPFLDAVREAPAADVHVFGLGDTVDSAWLRLLQSTSGSTCLFAKDAGGASFLA